MNDLMKYQFKSDSNSTRSRIEVHKLKEIIILHKIIFYVYELAVAFDS
jgi:hypothetical protein